VTGDGHLQRLGAARRLLGQEREHVEPAGARARRRGAPPQIGRADSRRLGRQLELLANGITPWQIEIPVRDDLLDLRVER
jgi:hypothetical protein